MRLVVEAPDDDQAVLDEYVLGAREALAVESSGDADIET